MVSVYTTKVEMKDFLFQRISYRQFRWWIVIGLLVVTGWFGVRTWRISALPEKERRLVEAQHAFKLASMKYKWSSRSVDFLASYLGPKPSLTKKVNQLAAHKKKASETLRRASYLASTESLGEFTDSNESHEAWAKFALSGFSRKYHIRVTSVHPGTFSSVTEIRVPNQFAEEGKSILESCRITIFENMHFDSAMERKQAMEGLRSQGIECVSIPYRTTNVGVSDTQVLAVLQENKEQALKILSDI